MCSVKAASTARDVQNVADNVVIVVAVMINASVQRETAYLGLSVMMY